MCEPKASGGLTVTSLVEWNMAAISKMLWNIHAKADKLWVQWIHMYFLKGKSVFDYQPGSNCSWILKRIFKYRDVVTGTRTWVGVANGQKFRTVDLYRELRGPRLRVNWRKLLYRSLARPRAVFVLWLCLLGRLSTKDRFLRIGIISDGKCEFCGLMESVAHLFFDCPVTQQISKSVLVWIGYTHTPAVW